MTGRNFSFPTTLQCAGSGALIATLAFACATPAIAEDVCRPVLALSDLHFSEMQPPMLSRTWSAVASVDVSHCPANTTGTFDIVFIREKESAPDLAFRQRFAWHSPSVKVQVDFAADEAVQSYSIDNVTSCVCGN